MQTEGKDIFRTQKATQELVDKGPPQAVLEVQRKKKKANNKQIYPVSSENLGESVLVGPNFNHTHTALDNKKPASTKGKALKAGAALGAGMVVASSFEPEQAASTIEQLGMPALENVGNSIMDQASKGVNGINQVTETSGIGGELSKVANQTCSVIAETTDQASEGLQQAADQAAGLAESVPSAGSTVLISASSALTGMGSKLTAFAQDRSSKVMDGFAKVEEAITEQL